MKIKKKERSSSLYKMQRFPSDIPNVVSTNFNREGTINKTPIIESRMTNFLKDFLFASLSCMIYIVSYKRDFVFNTD